MSHTHSTHTHTHTHSLTHTHSHTHTLTHTHNVTHTHTHTLTECANRHDWHLSDSDGVLHVASGTRRVHSEGARSHLARGEVKGHQLQEETHVRERPGNQTSHDKVSPVCHAPSPPGATVSISNKVIEVCGDDYCNLEDCDNIRCLYPAHVHGMYMWVYVRHRAAVYVLCHYSHFATCRGACLWHVHRCLLHWHVQCILNNMMCTLVVAPHTLFHAPPPPRARRQVVHMLVDTSHPLSRGALLHDMLCYHQEPADQKVLHRLMIRSILSNNTLINSVAQYNGQCQGKHIIGIATT